LTLTVVDAAANRRHLGLSVSLKDQAATRREPDRCLYCFLSNAHNAVGQRAADRELAPDPAR
jgi:hypothetical protein